jgi:hypothetical protein
MMSIDMTGEGLLALKEKLAREISEGGDLPGLPCPYCYLPRCQRSDYIRCSKCGLNWDMGTEYDRHPSMSGKPRTELK